MEINELLLAMTDKLLLFFENKLASSFLIKFSVHLCNNSQKVKKSQQSKN